MRYFTTEFLVSPSPGWTADVLFTGTMEHPVVGGQVKHVETGHIWKLTGEAEPWGNTFVWLGRWPD
jgi:hypothetical protein